MYSYMIMPLHVKKELSGLGMCVGELVTDDDNNDYADNDDNNDRQFMIA